MSRQSSVRLYVCLSVCLIVLVRRGVASNSVSCHFCHTKLLKQLCISACSQLIAAQPQLIACYAYRQCERERERERDRYRQRNGVSLGGISVTDKPRTNALISCRLSVCGLNCHLMCCDYDNCVCVCACKLVCVCATLMPQYV